MRCLFSLFIRSAPNNVAPQIQTSMLKVQKHLRRAELDALLRQRVDLQVSISILFYHIIIFSHRVLYGFLLC
jgi:hypothetical protein